MKLRRSLGLLVHLVDDLQYHSTVYYSYKVHSSNGYYDIIQQYNSIVGIPSIAIRLSALRSRAAPQP